MSSEGSGDGEREEVDDMGEHEEPVDEDDYFDEEDDDSDDLDSAEVRHAMHLLPPALQDMLGELQQRMHEQHVQGGHNHNHNNFEFGMRSLNQQQQHVHALWHALASTASPEFKSRADLIEAKIPKDLPELIQREHERMRDEALPRLEEAVRKILPSADEAEAGGEEGQKEEAEREQRPDDANDAPTKKRKTETGAAGSAAASKDGVDRALLEAAARFVPVEFREQFLRTLEVQPTVALQGMQFSDPHLDKLKRASAKYSQRRGAFLDWRVSSTFGSCVTSLHAPAFGLKLLRFVFESIAAQDLCSELVIEGWPSLVGTKDESYAAEIERGLNLMRGTVEKLIFCPCDAPMSLPRAGFPLLRYLNISDVNLGNGEIFSAVAACKSLRELEVSVASNSAAVSAISPCVLSLPRLMLFAVRLQCVVSMSTLLSLATSLKAPQLKRARFEGKGFTGAFFKAVTWTLPSLEKLYVESSQFHARIISRCPKLLSLCLADVTMTGRPSSFPKHMGAHTVLRKLRMGECQISTHVLVRAVLNNSSIRSISLSNMSGSMINGVAVACTMREAPLEELYCFQTSGTSCAVQCSAQLMWGRGLRKFHLRDFTLENDHTGQMFCTALQTELPQLALVSFAEVFITSKRIEKKFLSALHSSGVPKIYLQNVNFRDKRVDLEPLLARNERLQSLRLYFIHCAENLPLLLRECKSLRKLGVHTRMGSDDVEEVTLTVPQDVCWRLQSLHCFPLEHELAVFPNFLGPNLATLSINTPLPTFYCSVLASRLCLTKVNKLRVQFVAPGDVGFGLCSLDNYSLLGVDGIKDCAAVDFVLQRNASLRNACRAAALLLIQIRKLRKRECGLLGLVPVEVVNQIGRYIYSTRADAAWMSRKFRDFEQKLRTQVNPAKIWGDLENAV